MQSNHNAANVNQQSKFLNKFIQVAELIQEYINEADTAPMPEIITELHACISQAASDEQIGIILIKNYLQPCENEAALFMKMVLPDIFNKQELLEILKNEIFTPEEKENFNEIYLRNIPVEKAENCLALNSMFFSSDNPREIQKCILEQLSSEKLINMAVTSKSIHALSFEILFERFDDEANTFQNQTLEGWIDQINNKTPLNQIFPVEKINYWIEKLKNIMNKHDVIAVQRINSAILLQYLWGSEPEKINDNPGGMAKWKKVFPISKLKKQDVSKSLRPATKSITEYSDQLNFESIDINTNIWDKVLDIIDNKGYDSLPELSKQLTSRQRAICIYRCLQLLDENVVQSARILHVVASDLSPCPYDVVDKLISKASKNNKKRDSYCAIGALLKLKPHNSVFKNDIITINELDQFMLDGFIFQYIINASSMLSNLDISDNLICNLIDVKRNCELKKKTLFSLSMKFSEKQVHTYINHCCKGDSDEHDNKLILLTAISPHLLKGKLDSLSESYLEIFKNEGNNVRLSACINIRDIKSILHLFPDNFISDFITLLNDSEDWDWSVVCEFLPDVLHYVSEKYVADVFETILKKVSIEFQYKNYIRITTIVCLGLLAHRLNQDQLTRAKNSLINNLDEISVGIIKSTYISLIKMAHYFSGHELSSLIDILAKKSDSNTCVYLLENRHLMTKYSLNIVFENYFNELISDKSNIRIEACITAVNMVAYLSKDEAIVFTSKLIKYLQDAELKKDNPDFDGTSEEYVGVLNALILLADILTAEQFQVISVLPFIETAEIIACQYILKTLYDHKFPDECVEEQEQKNEGFRL